VATRSTRKARSRQTEKHAAAYLQYIFPQAEAVASSLSGKDILNTPGLAAEVKSRRDLDLTAWLRQAEKNASPEELPVVIHRPDGFGVESVDTWPVTMRFYEFLLLLRKAGYGSDDSNP
jgi:hypothetical protein